jgi:hypothetical protein
VERFAAKQWPCFVSSCPWLCACIRCLQAIDIDDFRVQICNDGKQDGPAGDRVSAHLMAAIQQTNNVCLWVVAMILNKWTPSERSSVLIKFIKVCRVSIRPGRVLLVDCVYSRCFGSWFTVSEETQQLQ